MPALSVMIKPSSGNCNMRCDYCFYCDEMSKREQKSYGYMSEETLQNVIRKTMLQAEHQISYAYQGGEPTLRGLDFFKKAIEFQKKYNQNRIRVLNSLQTNGFALNEEWCRFLKENNFLVGVSVDGSKEIHDGYRHCAKDGSPTYEIIKNNIKLLEKYKVDFNILTVVTNRIAENAKEVYESYKKNNWMFQQYIECLDPLGDGHETKWTLQNSTYGKFLVELFELWYHDLKEGTQPYIRRFENYIQILLGMRPEACEQCGQCGIQIVVEADGSAYPCDFFMLDEYKLGNFNEDRLPSMNTRREEIGFIEKSRNISSDCKKCKYYGICRNGCQRSRDIVPHENTYKNRFCEAYTYFFDHCLDDLIDIAKKISRTL